MKIWVVQFDSNLVSKVSSLIISTVSAIFNLAAPDMGRKNIDQSLRSH